MKRGVEDIEAEFGLKQQRTPNQKYTNPEKEQVPKRTSFQENTNFPPQGEIKWTEKSPDLENPLEKLRRRSTLKEAERQKSILPDEFKYRQAVNMMKNETEEKQKKIKQIFERISMLKEYTKSLQQVEMLVQKNITEKIRFKGNAKRNFNQKMVMFRSEKLELSALENKSNKVNLDAENKVKKILDEICHLKNNKKEEEINKEIEKIKIEREEKKKRRADMEMENKQKAEKEKWEEKLEVSLAKVKELNKMHNKESIELRILTQKLSKIRKKARILAVLVPKENVENPFLYEPYIRVSKHHRALTLVNNPKILEPESHTLHDLGERVGDTENFIQKLPIKEIFKENLEKSMKVCYGQERGEYVSDEFSRISIGDGLSKNIQPGEMEEEQIINQNREREMQGSLLGALKPTLRGSDNFEFKFKKNRNLSDKAKDFMNLIKPSPIKVYNNAVLIKKLSRSKKYVKENVTCKFDLVITNDYMSTYYDNNVILKLYSEIEIFVKSILYENIEEIFKSFPYDSNQYQLIFDTLKQRDDFNMYYHLENPDKKDTNILLSEETKNSLSSIFENNILLKNDEKKQEMDVKKMRFVKKVLPHIGKMDFVGDKKETLNYSLFFIGDRNRGIMSGLLRILYEDMKSFDNRCIYVYKIDFKIELLDDNKEIKNFEFDNFADFLTEFEKNVSYFLYKKLIKISLMFQIGSKLEPTYSRTRKLTLCVIPHLFGQKPKFSENLKKVLNAEPQLEIESLDIEEKIINEIMKETQDYTVIAEMPHLIKVSKEAPGDFSNIQKLVSFISNLTEF